jgi:hypothetical protein
MVELANKEMLVVFSDKRNYIYDALALHGPERRNNFIAWD